MASSFFQGESAVKIAVEQGRRELFELVRDTRAVQNEDHIDRGLWKRALTSTRFIPPGHWGQCRAALHGCDQHWGAAVDLVLSIPSFIDFWTLKGCTGVVGFLFSWFKDWYLWVEKCSERGFPLSPTSALKSHQLFLLWSVLRGYTAQGLEILSPAESSRQEVPGGLSPHQSCPGPHQHIHCEGSITLLL